MLISLPTSFSRFIFITVLNENPAATTKRRHEAVRLGNLELLVVEAGSATTLARLANTSGSYLSQIRNQIKTPKGTPRGVGDSLAAKLEQAMGKPDGWMDEPHSRIPDVAQPAPRKPASDSQVGRLHPLISWGQASQWARTAGHHERGDIGDRLPCPVPCSTSTFVLRVRGESMEPRFHDGDLIFVDPEVTPVSGRYAVVQLGDAEEATFKQLIVEGGHQYLKALNPDWPQRIIEMNSTATICGVVVFKGELV